MAIGLNNLKAPAGATHKKKRVGRGPGSGLGKTSGRGNKGQKSRSGYSRQRGFEGGQMPLHRRLPKRGFTNIFKKEWVEVNLSDLDSLFEAGTRVTPEELVKNGVIRRSELEAVVILGQGTLGKALNVSAHRFSASARRKIEEAGGQAEVIASPAVSRK